MSELASSTPLDTPLLETVMPALAHEIRQPLGAIEAIAYYMSMLRPNDAKQREQLSRIQRLVEQSNWILSSSLALTDTRPCAPESIDLEELILQLVANRFIASDPPLNFELAPRLPLVRMDVGFAHTMIETLLGLFRQLAAESHPATLRTTSCADGVMLEISTAAPGYRNVASLPPGSALGLDCARRIAEMHGGSFTCSIDPLSGIRAQVMLP